MPKQRLLFQGDLFILPSNDAPVGPPQESTLAFVRWLKDSTLKTEMIASVHGRTTSIEEFVQATSINSASAAR
ncbi:MAG: hypothetical protein JNN30_21755 [Rhodanobacteraceae bacterium]|nr:hypothetical protein [Rhodanobacteraceae bacterium]